MGGLFRWNNTQSNLPPVWNGLPATFNFSGGQALSQFLGSYVADPNSLGLTFAKGETWPSWLGLDTSVPNNPAITVTALDQVGTFGPFHVNATNSNGIPALSPGFTVTVVKGVNRAPVWNGVPAVINTTPGSPINLLAFVSDLDADGIVFAPVNPVVLPANWGLTAAGLLTVSPTAANGVYNFIFGASDGVPGAPGTATTNSPTVSINVQGVSNNTIIAYRADGTSLGTFPTLVAAYNAMPSGGRIEASPGDYTAVQHIIPGFTKSGTLKCAALGQLIKTGRQYDGDVPQIGAVITFDGLWIEGLKPLPNGQGPSRVGNNAFGFAGKNSTITIQNCYVNECNVAVFGGGSTGAETATCNILNCIFTNNGNTDNPATHHIYIHPNYALIQGCAFYNTYDYTNPPNGDLWRVGIGMFIKNRGKAMDVVGCFLYVGTSSQSCCINADDGGVVTIKGNIIHMGPNSGYDPTGSNSDGQNPPPPNNSGGSKIIDYNFSGYHAVNELRVYQNTGVNAGKQLEKFVQLRNFQDLTAGRTLASYPNRPATFLTPPPVYDVKDNVVVVGNGCADINGASPNSSGGGGAADGSGFVPGGSVPASGGVFTSLWPTDGTNTITPVGQTAAQMLVNPIAGASMDWNLKTPVAGSQNRVDKQFKWPAGFIARSDLFRGAVTPVSEPLWRTRQRTMSPQSWKRFDKTNLESTSPQNWGGVPITGYFLNADPRFAVNNPGVQRPGFDQILVQSAMCMRQKGAWVMGRGGGHLGGIANPLLGMQMNVPGDDVLGSQVHWIQLQVGSDYAASVGPIGGTYNAHSGSNPDLLNNAGSIDVHTNYADPTVMFATSAGLRPRSAIQGWMRDGIPGPGHEVYAQWFYDTDDVMLNLHQNGAYYTGGTQHINKFSWPTLSWNQKINQLLAIDPLDSISAGGVSGPNAWLSPFGNWNDLGNAGLFFVSATMDPATGDVYRMTTANRFAKWKYPGTDPATRFSMTNFAVTNGLNQSYPSVVVPTVNKLFYFDPTSVLGPDVQDGGPPLDSGPLSFYKAWVNFTLRSWDLATGAAGATFALNGDGVNAITHLSRQSIKYGTPQEGAFYCPPLDCIVYLPLDLNTMGIWLINYRTGATRNWMPKPDPRFNAGPGVQAVAGVREGTMKAGWSTELNGMWFVSCAIHAGDAKYPPNPQDARGTGWFLDFTGILPDFSGILP